MQGCVVVYYAGMPLVYDSIESTRTFADIPYSPLGETDRKNRLNFYLPDTGTSWPVLIFVHGGGWTSGDKDLTFGGKDIYLNIGRYYASKGIATAVINYRLIPGVHWESQVNDVATAVAWVQNNAGSFGADSSTVFLAGHSAGSHLISRVALDPAVLTRAGGRYTDIAGVIAVSGAGYDMTDEETNRSGLMTTYLERRFSLVDRSENWPVAASTLQYATADAPPFLIMYGGSEFASLKRQSRMLHDALVGCGVDSKLVEVPGRKHARMILLLSKDGGITSTAVRDFIFSGMEKG